MADHLSDKEQVELLKSWWHENGRFLILAVIVTLAAYLGWQWWSQYQKSYAESAAAVYTELSETVATANGEALTEAQQKTVQFLIEQLQTEYDRTLYSANASLLAAKLAVEKNDLDKAVLELTKALNYDDKDIQAVAKLRLAKVYFSQKKYDEALDKATYDKEDSFSSAYAALKGDILSAKGDSELARGAYQQALNTLGPENSLQRRLLEIKLSDLPKAGDQS